MFVGTGKYYALITTCVSDVPPTRIVASREILKPAKVQLEMTLSTSTVESMIWNDNILAWLWKGINILALLSSTTGGIFNVAMIKLCFLFSAQDLECTDDVYAVV